MPGRRGRRATPPPTDSSDDDGNHLTMDDLYGGGSDSFEYDGYSNEALSTGEDEDDDFSRYDNGTHQASSNSATTRSARRSKRQHANSNSAEEDDQPPPSARRLLPTIQLRGIGVVHRGVAPTDAEVHLRRVVLDDAAAEDEIDAAEPVSKRNRSEVPRPTLPATGEGNSSGCVVVVVCISPSQASVPADAASAGLVGESFDVILASLSSDKPSALIAVCIPAGASYELSLRAVPRGDSTSAGSRSWTVNLFGEEVPRRPGTSFYVARRWFEVAPNVRRAALTTSDGDVTFAPTGAVCELQRREGSKLFLADRRDHVGFARLKHSGQTSKERMAIRRSHRVVGLADDWVPYQRWFQPASADRIVRVRRFPHRNADVLAEMSPATVGLAIGLTTDLATGDRYVVWAAPHEQPQPDAAVWCAVQREGCGVAGGGACPGGGFSRVRGDGGLFLTEVPWPIAPPLPDGDGDDVGGGGAVASTYIVEAFAPQSRWYFPSSTTTTNHDTSNGGTRGAPEGNGGGRSRSKKAAVAATNETPAVLWGSLPSSSSAHIGCVERNEVVEAVAVWGCRCTGRRFLQLARGGYALLSVEGDINGPLLVPVPAFDQPLRCRLREPRNGNSSANHEPEVIDLTTSRGRAQARGDHDDDAGPTKKDARPAHVDAADACPELRALRERLGTLTLQQYPEVHLRGVSPPAQGVATDEEEEDEEEDSELSDGDSACWHTMGSDEEGEEEDDEEDEDEEEGYFEEDD